MKLTDIFPGINEVLPNKKNSSKSNNKLLVAHRPPYADDEVNHLWWYDRSNKIMYRATDKGYIKD